MKNLYGLKGIRMAAVRLIEDANDFRTVTRLSISGVNAAGTAQSRR